MKFLAFPIPFSRKDFSFLSIFILSIHSIYGLRVDEKIYNPNFGSLSAFEGHQMQILSKSDFNDPNQPPQKAMHISEGQHTNNERLQKQVSQLLSRQQAKLGDFSLLLKEEKAKSQNERLIPALIHGYRKKLRDSSVTVLDPSQGLSFAGSSIGDPQYWNKRDAASNSAVAKSPSKVSESRKKKYEEDDKDLENLKPFENCTEKLEFCSKMPIKYVECFLNCYLSTNVVPQPKLKFIFRLMRVLISYSRQLCTSFGEIYKQIVTVLSNVKFDASMRGFLVGLGLTEYDSAEMTVFVKNSPNALFNNLAYYGRGAEFELVKEILQTAEDALNVLAIGKSIFPAMFENPLCLKSLKPTWYIPIIDLVAKHPLTVDIFLRGYYVMTRALTQSLPYPTEAMFVSLAYALKLMIGVDCSIVSYAETGEVYKCLQPPPIDDILAFYQSEAEIRKNPNDWIVCGAYQVEVPEFSNMKKELGGRSGGLDLNSTKIGKQQQPVEEFPVNVFPDELLDDDCVLC